MWAGHEWALAYYTWVCISEWQRRGYKNSIELPHPPHKPMTLPPWIGDERFHSSHRSNLLRKLPSHYSQFGWTDNPSAPYVWPI